jgi:uncharacterized membrane protein (UPF0182 family)
LKAAVVLVSAGVALFFALGFYTEWDTYLRFRYGGSFGVSDPLFGVDVGFYVFHLPFYELLQSSLTLLTVLTFGIVLSGLRVPLDYCGQAGAEAIEAAAALSASFRASLYSGCQLGMGILPRSLSNSSTPRRASSMEPAIQRIM